MAGEHILIVDDEQAIQTTLRGVLEDESYRVTTVGTGADALRLHLPPVWIAVDVDCAQHDECGGDDQARATESRDLQALQPHASLAENRDRIGHSQPGRLDRCDAIT